MIATGLDGRPVNDTAPPMSPVDYSDTGDMAIYDALPPVVREALNVTIQKWKPASARDALAAGYPAHKLAAVILKMDADKAHKERFEVWGFR